MTVVKALNDVPALRWIGMVAAIVVSAIGMTWTISARVADMQRDVTEIRVEIGSISDAMREMDKRVRNNEEFRIASEARERAYREFNNREQQRRANEFLDYDSREGEE